jgi:undecaprenyl pyrophosphate synthase
MIGRATPATIMGEVSAPRADKQRETSREREAFRAFMTTNRLRATQWAKDAGVPVSEIYAYLTGKTRAMPSEVAERLARVARTRSEDMFR